MVDVTRPSTSAGHPSKFGPNVRLPYLIEVEVSAAELIAAKGSAIAAADVYDLVRVPAGSVVLGAYLQKTEAFAGTSTDLTLDFGVTGGDVDAFVDGWDYDAAALGSHAPLAAGQSVGVLFDAAGVLSLLVATQTGTWTGGAIRAQVLVLDVSDKQESGIAQLGS